MSLVKCSVFEHTSLPPEQHCTGGWGIFLDEVLKISNSCVADFCTRLQLSKLYNSDFRTLMTWVIEVKSRVIEVKMTS